MNGGAWQVTYNPWGRKESDSDMTEWLHLTCLVYIGKDIFSLLLLLEELDS